MYCCVLYKVIVFIHHEDFVWLLYCVSYIIITSASPRVTTAVLSQQNTLFPSVSVNNIKCYILSCTISNNDHVCRQFYYMLRRHPPCDN